VAQRDFGLSLDIEVVSCAQIRQFRASGRAAGLSDRAGFASRLASSTEPSELRAFALGCQKMRHQLRPCWEPDARGS